MNMLLVVYLLAFLGIVIDATVHIRKWDREKKEKLVRAEQSLENTSVSSALVNPPVSRS